MKEGTTYLLSSGGKSSGFQGIEQWLSTGGDFAPQGTFGNVWRHFWLSPLWRKMGG